MDVIITPCNYALIVIEFADTHLYRLDIHALVLRLLNGAQTGHRVIDHPFRRTAKIVIFQLLGSSLSREGNGEVKQRSTLTRSLTRNIWGFPKIGVPQTDGL